MDDTSEFAITSHAYKRLRKRLGWNKKTADRMIDRVFEKGVRKGDLSGKIESYMNWLKVPMSSRAGGCYPIIFAEHVFIFKGRTLITVFHGQGHHMRAITRIKSDA